MSSGLFGLKLVVGFGFVGPYHSCMLVDCNVVHL